jgi:hypothetical protein
MLVITTPTSICANVPLVGIIGDGGISPPPLLHDAIGNTAPAVTPTEIKDPHSVFLFLIKLLVNIFLFFIFFFPYSIYFIFTIIFLFNKNYVYIYSDLAGVRIQNEKFTD